MIEEKPLRILRRMGVDELEIQRHTDISAWQFIYANKPVPKVKPATICFTGFSDAQRRLLCLDAAALGLVVTTQVSGTTKYVCTGPNAGPAKLKKAKEAGSTLLDLGAFYAIFEAGELP